jgi:RNA polymerase sigma-70 factor (ECF subfamily)
MKPRTGPTGSTLPRTPRQFASPSDEQLLSRTRRHADGAAFEALVQRHRHDLLAYLRRYLGDLQLAEDVLQATFLQVHLKRASFTPGRRFRPWLYAIATHQAIDAQRRNRRHRAVSLDHRYGVPGDQVALVDMLAGPACVVESRIEAEERTAWVRAAVSRLPDPMQRVLALVVGEGLHYREAAAQLGIPVGTVKSRMHAALERLGRESPN